MNPACSALERAGDKLLAGKERAVGLGPLQKAGEGREVTRQEAKQREEGASLCSPCGWSYKGLREMDKKSGSYNSQGNLVPKLHGMGYYARKNKGVPWRSNLEMRFDFSFAAAVAVIC